MKTVTFYSYKGGVGRSLALANIANRLSEFGKSVCLLDFDLEAPGLHIKFSDGIGKNRVRSGLVDYIYEFTTNNVVPGNILDFTTYIGSVSKDRGKISLIAAGDTSTQDYWKKLSNISWTKLFYEKDSFGIDFFYNLKLQIEKQLKPDFLLIDSRTGITDIAGVTMSIMADEVVLFAANNPENLDGIGQVLCSLADPSNSLRNATPKINVVLSRIPFFKNPKDKSREANAKNAAIRILNEKLSHRGIMGYRIEKIFVIHSEPEFEMQEEIRIHHKEDGAFGQSTIPIKSDYLELFKELTMDVVDEEEADALDNFKRAADLIDKAILLDSPEERIKLLNESIGIYVHYFAFLQLGIAYTDLSEYENAILNFDKAEKLNGEIRSTVEYFKGYAFYMQGKLDQAIMLFESQLERETNLDTASGMLGMIYHKKKEYDKSIKYYSDAINIDSENPILWNGYANSLKADDRVAEAFEAIYRALELEPQHIIATLTLAELYAEMGNYREFYKNMDLAFSLGLSAKDFQRIVSEEDAYRQFINEDKFQSILAKYDIDVDWKFGIN